MDGWKMTRGGLPRALAVLAGVPGEFPRLWPGIAVALAPFVAFMARASYGEETGRAFTTAFLQGGTVVALALAARGPAGAVSRASPWVAALAGGGLLAALASGRPLESLPGLSDILTGLLAFALVLRAGPGKVAGPLAAGLAVGGTLAAGAALWQSWTGIPLPAGEMERLRGMDPAVAAAVEARVGEGRVFGPFESPGALAAFLVLALPVAVERALHSWGRESARVLRRGGWVWGVAAAAMAAALPATGSIGAAAALTAAFVAVTVAGARMGRQARLIVAAACVLLFISVIAIRPPGAAFDHARAKARHWVAALGAVPVQSLILGAGPGSYGEAAGGRMEPGLASRRAHNWLVETVVEDGVLGAAGLAGALGLLLAAFPAAVVRGNARGSGASLTLPLRGNARGNPVSATPPLCGGAGWGLAAGWLAWLIQSMADYTYAVPSLAFSWWAMAGLVGAPLLPAASRARARFPRISLPRTAGPWLVAAVLLALTLTRGLPSALLLGGVLMVAVFAGFRRMLEGEGGAPAPAAGPGASPWAAPGAALGVVAAGWVAFAPAPGPALRVVLEGAGLAALAWSVRRMLEGDGSAERRLATGVAVVIAGHGTYAVVEGVLTGGPAYTSFPSPGFLAAFLSGGLGLCAWSAAGRKGMARAACVTAGLLAAAGIYSTRTAAGMLALAGVAAALVAVAAFRSGRIPVHGDASAPAPVTPVLPAAIRIVIAAAVVIPLLAVRPASMSIVQRMDMWTEAARALRSVPLGSGPGSYAEASAPFRLPSVTGAGIGRYSLRAPFAHCEPLQFAVEWGLPALGLAVWAVVSLARLAVVRAPAWGLFAVGPLVYGLWDFPLRAPPIEAALAIAAGAILAAGRPGRMALVRASARRRAGTGALVVAAAAWAGVAVLRPALSRLALESPGPGLPGAMAAAVRAKAAFPAAAAAHALEGGVRWAAAAAARPVDGRGAMLAEEAMRRACALAPADAGVESGLGEQMLERALRFRDRAALGAAADSFSRAVALDPTWFVPRLWLARARMAQGRPAEAAAGIRMVLDLEPSCLEAVVIGGMLAEGSGDRARARREYRRALVMRGTLSQRPGPNAYELELIRVNEGWIRGRLMEMGE